MYYASFVNSIVTVKEVGRGFPQETAGLLT